MSPKPDETPCPMCGELALEVAPKLVAHEIGTFSLAGQTMKFSAHWELRWWCSNCGGQGRAEASLT